MKKLVPPSGTLVAVFRAMLQKKTVRYLVVGGTVYLLELWVIMLAQQRGATPTEAVAISFTIGLVVSFFLQKLVTFGDKRMHHKVVLVQAVAVGLLVVWNLCFTVALTSVMQSLLPPTVTRTIALLITTIWNFYLYKTRIFAPPHTKHVTVERPSLLLGVRRTTPSVHTPADERPTKEIRHNPKATSLFMVCLCAGLIAALVSAATLMQSISDSSKKTAATSAPLDDTRCTGETVMQFVAHEDDDLLFMNPDLQHAVDQGKCVRTVYITAGNAGMGLDYAKQREYGAQAAYATILHLSPGNSAKTWRRQYVRLAEKTSVEIAVPPATPNASLVFYRLPDGGIDGKGYGPAGEPPRSLAGLLDGVKPTLTTVDGRNVYTAQSLVASLAQLIARYNPAEIRTLGASPEELALDHSDHIATGWLVRQAFALHKASHPSGKTSISFYIGYPVIQRDKNLSPSDLAAKESAFLAYAKYDGSVCQSFEACNSGENAYVSYLPRMYTISESEIYSWNR